MRNKFGLLIIYYYESYTLLVNTHATFNYMLTLLILSFGTVNKFMMHKKLVYEAKRLGRYVRTYVRVQVRTIS